VDRGQRRDERRWTYSSWAFKGRVRGHRQLRRRGGLDGGDALDGGTTVELSLDAAQATATEESASDDETETESTSAVGPAWALARQWRAPARSRATS